MHQSWLLRTVCSSASLLCFTASALCLLSGVSSFKKGEKCFMFPLAVAVPRPAALTIFGPQLCLGKCPKEESALPKKKSKLGDDVASGKKNRDLFRELHTQGLPQCPQARWRLLNKKNLPTFLSWRNQKSLRIWSF